MKVLASSKRFGNSINFVDDNNVLVGWDEYQSCCEDVDHFFSYIPFELVDVDDADDADFDPYFFDKKFLEYESGRGYDEGGAVCFKLTAEGKRDIYLNLYNSHNGYYSHGFVFMDNDSLIEEGSL